MAAVVLLFLAVHSYTQTLKHHALNTRHTHISRYSICLASIRIRVQFLGQDGHGGLCLLIPPRTGEAEAGVSLGLPNEAA